MSEIWESQVNIYFLKNIHISNIAEIIGNSINYCMLNNTKLQGLHTRNGFKNYVFSNPTNIENGVYKENTIGVFKIRARKDILPEIINSLGQLRNALFIVLKTDMYSYNIGKIKKLQTITPTIMTFKTMEVDDLIKKEPIRSLRSYNWIKGCDIKLLHTRIENNLRRKYENIYGKLEKEIPIIDNVKLLNEIPIKIKYKNKFLLGNKLQLEFTDTDMRKVFVNIAMTAGILEKNSCLGCGFTIPVKEGGF